MLNGHLPCLHAISCKQVYNASGLNMSVRRQRCNIANLTGFADVLYLKLCLTLHSAHRHLFVSRHFILATTKVGKRKTQGSFKRRCGWPKPVNESHSLPPSLSLSLSLSHASAAPACLPACERRKPESGCRTTRPPFD